MSLVESVSDPLARFDLDSLIEGCARLRPGRTAVSDGTGARISFAELDLGSRAMAGALASLGLAPGECVLVPGVPRVATLLGIFAALRAGLDVALAPPQLSSAETAAFAARAKCAAALIGGRYGETSPLDTVMQAAATCENLRMLCSLEGGADGAVDLNEFATPDYRIDAACARAARLVTFVPGGALRHTQRTLIAATLDAATRLHLSDDRTLLSTIAPASFAGLVAGPLLALLSGASLHLHGPFLSATLLEDLTTHGPAHLLVPRAVGTLLEEARLLSGRLVASLLLLHRATRADESAIALSPAECPVFDLTAFGETCLLVEPRDAHGDALPPAATPHMIEFDGSSILAARRAPGVGALRFEGEAVTTL
jgi:acyl-CoA synthetase (AMP-forming)/AMP-acid ligase II